MPLLTGTTLISAIRYSDNERIKRLLENRQDSEYSYGYPRAARMGNLECINLMLKYKYLDPSILNNKAIIEASENGHHQVVNALLADPRVDPSAQNNQAIIKASENGHHQVVNVLLTDPRVVIPDEYKDKIVLK